MPRQAAIVPNRHVHTTLPEQLAGRLEILLWSEAEMRVPKGAMQDFLVARITEYFNNKSLDLAPYLGSNPGECIISGSEITLSRIENLFKEIYVGKSADPVDGRGEGSNAQSQSSVGAV